MTDEKSPSPGFKGAGGTGGGVVAQERRATPTKVGGEVLRPHSHEPVAHISAVVLEHGLHIDVDELVARRRKAFFLQLVLFVGVPTLLMSLYVGLVATPRYVSEFQIIYRSNDTMTSSTSSTLSSLVGSAGQPDMNRVLATYLVSDAALRAVDKKIGLREKLADPKIDWWMRLPKGASHEKFLTYYQGIVTLYEQTGGYLTVDVEGFDRESAKAIAEAMIAAADGMVDDMVDKPRKDMLDYTRREMLRYESELRDATDKITDFRNTYHDYDFASTVARLGDVVSTLQGQLAQARSDLTYARTYLKDNAPSVAALNSRIAALEGQIRAEKSRLATSAPGAGYDESGSVGPNRGGPYSQVMADYADLVQNQEFAKAAYLASRQAYEAARLDAAKKQGYVVSFVPPVLPEQSTEPDMFRYVGTTFAASLMLYVIGSLLIGLLNEQSGF